MNKRTLALAVLSLFAVVAQGCGSDADTGNDADQSELQENHEQRVTFGGVSVGFGDKASTVVSELKAEHLNPETIEMVGLGSCQGVACAIAMAGGRRPP